ncbi:MAG: ATP-binding protein [Candidatus Margulisiibacteriota bacterium]|jgi:signal transduction histidine kinase/CheY-like chemotaxis protein
MKIEILKSIIDNLDQAALILEDNDKIVYCNQLFLELLELRKTPNDFKLNNYILNYNSEVNFCNFETIIKTNNKSIILNQFKINQTNLKFLYLKDNSKIKNVEIEIKRVKKEAEDLLKLKSEFFASMSHELRTPLHFILGTINFLLKKESIKKQYEVKVSLEMVKQSGQRLLELVNQILDLSKLASKKEEINSEVFLLEEIVFGLKDMMKTLIGPKPVKFYLDCDLNLQKNIFSDKRKINQIIVNLLSNSAKFTERGKIILNLYKLKDRLYFEVTDTGLGIPQEKLDTIFDPFVQVQGQETKQYKGTGLGLAISKQYVEILGGEIWVESQITEGSSFIFWIPYIEKETKKTKEKVTKNKQFENTDFIDKHLLICDDDNFNLTYLEMILNNKINYTLVNSGKELLTKANNNKYDLILIDIQMPEMDGIETLNQLKTIDLNKTTKVGALTAQAMAGDKENFLNKGFNCYLSKPFSEEGLFTFIKENL